MGSKGKGGTSLSIEPGGPKPRGHSAQYGTLRKTGGRVMGSKKGMAVKKTGKTRLNL